MLWKYGLGLITRRVSKLHCSRSADQISRCQDRRKQAIDAFIDVIHGEWDSVRLKAMAYTQLGEMAYALLKDEQRLRDYFPEKFSTWDEEKFYITALTMYNKETYILERYGQFLRYKKKYDDSESTLRKSLDIRPTSHAHHHLALTLKSKFHKHLVSQNRSFNRSFFSPNKASAPRRPFRRMQSEQVCGNRNPHVRNLFVSYADNSRRAGPQSPFDSGFITPPFGSNYGAQSHQEGHYYENPHGGHNRPGFFYHGGTLYNSGYYSNPQDHFSQHDRPHYDSKGYSRPETQGAERRGSSNMLNTRGEFRGSQQGGNDNQRNIPPPAYQSRNRNSNMHHRADNAYPQSRLDQRESNTKSFDEYDQLDSGIESLSTDMQNVSLQDSVERDGTVKLKMAEHRGPNFDDNIPAAGSRSNRTGAKHLKVKPTKPSPSTLDLNKIKAMIKSPKKLLYLPDADSRATDILYHLDQALVYSENRAALYDKGLTLRAMNHLDEAISVFRQLIGEESSLIYLANAYEQCGLCHYEKLQKSDIAVDEVNRITYNMKDFLMKSVAISAKFVAAIPNVSEVWASASSLKEILESDGKSKDSLKQLALLSERLSNYKEAISYYEELKNIEDDVREIPKHLMGVATNQMKDANYIAAVTVMDVARTHPEGHKCINKNVYLKCLVEGGFQAIETGHDKQLGYKYLKSALCEGPESKVIQGSAPNLGDCDKAEEDETFDIFLMCYEEHEHLYNITAKLWDQMSRDARKPVFGVSDQVRHKPA